MASATTVDPAGDGDDDFEDDEKQRGRGAVVEDDPDDNDYVPGISTQEDESEDEPDDEEVKDGEDEDGNVAGEEEKEENAQADRTADWPDKCTDFSQFFVGIGARNGAGIATYQGTPRPFSLSFVSSNSRFSDSHFFLFLQSRRLKKNVPRLYC